MTDIKSLISRAKEFTQLFCSTDDAIHKLETQLSRLIERRRAWRGSIHWPPLEYQKLQDDIKDCQNCLWKAKAQSLIQKLTSVLESHNYEFEKLYHMMIFKPTVEWYQNKLEHEHIKVLEARRMAQDMVLYAHWGRIPRDKLEIIEQWSKES